MLKLPFAEKLETAYHILIAGAGGGFDIFGGLPLYFALKAQGKMVHLANYSFTDLQAFDGEWLTPTMMKVTSETSGFDGLYFPEWQLAKWLAQHHITTPVFTFNRSGVLPLHQNYKLLVETLNLDTIILVDGGTDSLMRGDEDGLGTPGEDLASIASVFPLDIPHKMLMCVGFGVDHYHGVSNDLSFGAIAELTQLGGFLGSISLVSQMPEVEQYKAATEFVFSAMPQDSSIVSTSIITSIEGHYGDYHANNRTRGSKLWINPLMPICWFFNLEIVAKRNLLLEQLYLTDTFRDVVRAIATFRQFRPGRLRHRTAIPD